MSRASNTLRLTDVLTTPIKLKYTASYDITTYTSAGIKVLNGVNGPVTITGSIPQITLNYLSVRHLYYSNYLTGSFPLSGSYNFNWEQSTAASGTLDADIRFLPTGSGDGIKILSIPRSIFGEKISRNGFQLVSNDGITYNIVDDGNGNLVDIASGDLYVNANYFTPGESPTVGYVTGPSRNTKVGNIIYAQGVVIITNPDYYNVLDVGPTLHNQLYTYYDTDIPKQFDPLLNAQANSSPINVGSFSLLLIAGQQFPTYTVTGSLITLNPSDPLYTTAGSYITNYSVSSVAGTPSNTASITVSIIPNCGFTAVLDTYYYNGTPVLVYDFTNQLLYSNTGTSIRDLSGNNNYGTSSIGNGTGTPITTTGYTTVSPNYLSLPGGGQPSQELAVILPDYFKFTGTPSFTFATWINIQAISLGSTPGIVSCEGRSAGFPIGWSWYYDAAGGVTLARFNGAGVTESVTAGWGNMYSSPAAPYNQWLFLFAKYNGTNVTVGNIRPTSAFNGTYYEASASSSVTVTTTASFSCFMGLRYTDYAQANFAYLAGYQTALNQTELTTIYTATKAIYGY